MVYSFPHKLLTIKEVANILRLNVLTIYQYIKRGELKAVKFGRVFRVEAGELEKYIKMHTYKNEI